MHAFQHDTQQVNLTNANGMKPNAVLIFLAIRATGDDSEQLLHPTAPVLPIPKGAIDQEGYRNHDNQNVNQIEKNRFQDPIPAFKFRPLSLLLLVGSHATKFIFLATTTMTRIVSLWFFRAITNRLNDCTATT